MSTANSNHVSASEPANSDTISVDNVPTTSEAQPQAIENAVNPQPSNPEISGAPDSETIVIDSVPITSRAQPVATQQKEINAVNPQPSNPDTSGTSGSNEMVLTSENVSQNC